MFIKLNGLGRPTVHHDFTEPMHPLSLRPFLSSLLQKTSSSSLDFDFFNHLLHSSCNTFRQLRQLHSSLTTTGLFRHRHLAAQAIFRYSRLGRFDDARHLFDEISGAYSFLWNTMLRCYATNAEHGQALGLYLLMRRRGIPPNNYTFPFVLMACGSSRMGFVGKWVHCDVVKTGFESDLYVEAALVGVYAKCGEVDDGRKVFEGMLDRDLVSWTAMITAYEQSEQPEKSLFLFLQMQKDGLVADQVTAITVASAVAQLGDIKMARQFHCYMIQNGFIESVEAGNAVVAMYGKCSDAQVARLVFDGMERRDGISWNSMLSGYSHNGHAQEVISLFHEMQVVGSRPDPVTVLIIASACAYLGSLHLARQLHSFIASSRMEITITLSNAILDMYAKCGDLASATQIFKDYLKGKKDVTSWNVMISAYGMHGHGREALNLYHKMQEQGVAPDHITLTSLLSACSHAGLVEEGKDVFNSMRKDLLVMPSAKHYTCMVDLLGRAGHLEEARNLVEQMPLEPNAALWGALLGACRIHGNRELGELAARRLFCLEPEHGGYYVLLSNLYAVTTRWDEVGKLRETMKNRGLKKPAAYSMIEFGREVHLFRTAERSHPELVEIYRRLESSVVEMKMAGYLPDISCVLHDVEEEDKELILSLHSEKLAVVYGMMKLDKGLPIRVMKNLRICSDCHSAFRCISQLYEREIIVRDANRFHHFRKGSCSCNDYW